MYIQSLTIHGFKTFANKTHIELGKGVTSVIGPNGCGKSNIVDSIRWVLGEQSAKSMRGGEMTDVISNGNRKRKPSPFVDVTIILNNEDNSLAIDKVEVSIRRKLYRNGESEYHLNGEPARLKDIRELFMDTGIGAKTNTVIEQEQLTKLLQASSKERKIMIEEAAGISRFRQRRQESSLKLARVQDNMTRLDDIVSEVEKQKRTVSLQANKAVRFEDMKKELRKNRLDVAAMELHGWVEDRMQIEKRREQLKHSATELREKEQIDQQELENIEQKEIELEGKMAVLQEEQADFFQSYAELESSLKDNRTRIEILEKDIATLEAEVEKFSLELIETNKKVESKGEQSEQPSDLKELDQEIQDLKQKLENLEADLLQKRDILSQSKNHEIELIKKRSSLQNEKIKIESHLEYLERRLKQVIDKETELDSQTKNHQATESGDPEQDQSILSQAEESQKQKDELGGKIITTRHQLKELETELRKAVSETSGLRSRLSLLKEMEEKFEGIGAGVRNILDIYCKQHPDDLYPGGVHGVVADLVTVPEEYVDAIEAALGPRMQNLVMGTAEEAKNAIHFLRSKNFGRATMLPLDRIHPRNKLNGSVLSYPGVKGEAFNLVGFDPQYQRLFSHLLHGTLVVDTLDDGLKISKDHKIRIVTLDGDLINPEGAMTGGGKGKDSGILSRKVEIEELEIALGRQESDQKTRMQQHESLLHKEEKFQNQISVIDSRLKEMDEQVRMVHQKKAVAEREVIRIKQEKVLIMREKENLAVQMEDTKKELEIKVQSLSQLDQGQTDGEKTLVTPEEVQRFEEERNKTAAFLQERELKRVSILERSQSAQREMEYIIEKVAELEERLERRRKIIAERGEELEQRRVTILEQEAKFSVLEEEKGTKQADFFKMKQEREECRTRRNDIQKEGIKNSELLRKEEHELTELAVKEERLRVKQEELFNRIHNEFHVNIEDVYYDRRQNDDPLFLETDRFKHKIDELKKNMIELEHKLNNLGNVNFEAVEELKGLEEREGELKTQMSDLTGSYTKLNDLIKDLDKTCNERFKDTFDTVNEHFRGMFRRLFGGGQGNLQIEKDVDPLDAGITIQASPPGKSPKVLSQLSGGEKVLTTIAFLFSIFLYKPSPFCILDEIDAPLDEHNVDRLMEAIRSFTDRCQFMMVTHNRRTMSLSDVIHGVTMQETGISNCMSVSLEELNMPSQSVVEE